jgi:hypothetical protein
MEYVDCLDKIKIEQLHGFNESESADIDTLVFVFTSCL